MFGLLSFDFLPVIHYHAGITKIHMHCSRIGKIEKKKKKPLNFPELITTCGGLLENHALSMA